MCRISCPDGNGPPFTLVIACAGPARVEDLLDIELASGIATGLILIPIWERYPWRSVATVFPVTQIDVLVVSVGVYPCGAVRGIVHLLLAKARSYDTERGAGL